MINIKILTIVQHQQNFLLKHKKNFCFFISDFEGKDDPETVINTFLQKNIKIVPDTIKIVKVFRHHLYPEQVFLIYIANIDKENYLKTLNNENNYWLRPDVDLKNIKLCPLTQLVLSEVLNFKFNKEKNIKDQKFILYSDGGSRGNPGHSAIGYAIFNQEGKKILEGKDYIGVTVSSLSEYEALVSGIEAAIDFGIKKLECRVDNQMIVKQLNHNYNVKNREFWPVYEKINNMKQEFDVIKFVHIKREFNQIADSLVNQVLDQYLIENNS